MRDRYSISELANLFGISTQTLRYYDKINLFKPEYVDSTTGYRYYGYQQFFSLSMIIQLKRLDFSLEDIRNYSSSKQTETLTENLLHQKELIHSQIAQLQLLERKNESLLKKLQTSKSPFLGQICQVQIEPTRYQYEIPINFEIRDLYHYIKIMYESYIKSPLATQLSSHSEIVLRINQESLCQQQFRIYSSIGFFLDDPPQPENRGMTTIPGGKYATCLHVGAYDDIHKTYKRLYDYIVENHLTICGDSLEFAFISVALTDNKDDFITQVQIPVCK